MQMSVDDTVWLTSFSVHKKNKKKKIGNILGIYVPHRRQKYWLSPKAMYHTRMHTAERTATQSLAWTFFTESLGQTKFDCWTMHRFLFLLWYHVLQVAVGMLSQVNPISHSQEEHWRQLQQWQLSLTLLEYCVMQLIPNPLLQPPSCVVTMAWLRSWCCLPHSAISRTPVLENVFFGLSTTMVLVHC